MMPSVLAPATGRLELSIEMEKAVGGEGLGRDISSSVLDMLSQQHHVGFE